MRVSDAKRLFQEITKQYFLGANVIFSSQSRAAKPQLGLVVLTPGAVRRPQYPNEYMVSGETVGSYASRLNITVDLFTHGAAVTDPDTGETVAYENTATDDMMSFVDYLNSRFVALWCQLNDVTILTEGDVTDLTGAVNDNNYEYRARLNIVFYFTQYAVGSAGVLGETSILYPVYEREDDPDYEMNPSFAPIRLDEEGNPVIATDPETGELLYTPDPPFEYPSPLGDKPDIGKDMKVEPVFAETSVGGGSEDLAAEATGYFTEAEVKEEQ